MAVTTPFSDEKYMQLIAQGFSDKECARKMHVKEKILVSDYLPIILRKAEVSTREEAVLYARHKSYGLPPKEISSALRGVKMAQTRAFYRALERHFFQDDCLGCKSYLKYGVMLVKGQFHQHMELFLPDITLDVVELVSHLKDSHMISIHKDDEMYRITFKHLQTKEEGHNETTSNSV